MTFQGLSTLIRKAAWPGLVVLVLHTALAAIFGHEPYVDPAMHLLGGVAAAYFFSRIPELAPRIFGVLVPRARALMALGLTTTVAAIWEFLEYLSDLYLGTRAHTSIGSTLRDLLNGMLGALAFLLVDHLLRESGTGLRKHRQG